MNKPKVPKKVRSLSVAAKVWQHDEITRLDKLIECVEWLMENVIPLDPKECQLEMNELRTKWLEDVKDTIKKSFDTGIEAMTPKPREPEYCCDQFKEMIHHNIIRYTSDRWCVANTVAIDCCPFCGKELK